MKVVVFMVVIMAITINSSHFLRRLDASTTVPTSSSCTALGKDFDAGKPAQCKKGNSLYNVTDEAQCNAGTWGGKCSASAAEPITKAECGVDGATFQFSSEEVQTSAVCKIKDTDQEFSDANANDAACKAKIYQIDAKCKTDKIAINDCQGPATYISSDSCKAGDALFKNVNSYDCGEINLSWENGKCVVSSGFSCTATENGLTKETIQSSVYSIDSIGESDNCPTHPTFTSGTPNTCKAGTFSFSLAEAPTDQTNCDTITLSWQTASVSKCVVTGGLTVDDNTEGFTKSLDDPAVYYITTVNDQTDCPTHPTFTSGTPNTCNAGTFSFSLAEAPTDQTNCDTITLSWQTVSVSKCVVTGGYSVTDGTSGFTKHTVESQVCHITSADSQGKCPAHPTLFKTGCYTATGAEIEGKSSSDCSSTDLSKTEARCSISGVTYSACVAEFIPAGTKKVNKCKYIVNGKTILLTDESRLVNEDGCKAALTWESVEGCNGAIGDNQTDCEVKGEYTKSTDPSCVEKSSTASPSSSKNKPANNSNGVNLYFKFSLLLIITLLF